MTRARRLTVAACQVAHPVAGATAVAAAGRALAAAARAGASLALLPEYWFAAPGTDEKVASRGLVAGLSRAVPDVVVAGNEIHAGRHGLSNVCVVAMDGRELGAQAKLRPTTRERADGVAPGDALAAIATPAGRVVVLVCADVLYPELVAQAAALRPDVTLVPVMSRARFDDPTLRSRRDVFVARAFDTGSVVVKAAGYTHDGRIAGRSLVAAPWGLLAAAGHAFRDADLVAELDVARLQAFRAQHAGFTRPDGPHQNGPV